MSLENEATTQGKGISDEKQIVIFKLAEEEFGVEISEVREINRISEITKIPNTPNYIKGIINLRGSVIVVIDLATKLGLPLREFDNNTRIIVIEVGDTTTGMIVDSVTEVLRLKNEQIKNAPTAITKKIDADYIEGVGILDERLLILLDLAKVLKAKEIRNVMDSSKNATTPTPEKSTQSPTEPTSEAPVPTQESAPEEPIEKDKPVVEPTPEEPIEKDKPEEIPEPTPEEPKKEETPVEPTAETPENNSPEEPKKEETPVEPTAETPENNSPENSLDPNSSGLPLVINLEEDEETPVEKEKSTEREEGKK